MAVRARLTPAPPKRSNDPPSHPVRWASVRASQLTSCDRRMEAETYLSSGYGIRLALEARPGGWSRLEAVADVWMPNRLKGIQVGPDVGTPFLAATQVFDIRPVPRKWLALARTKNSARRFVAPGTILVTCSGTVGRATLAGDGLANVLISHDLLRVEPRDQLQWGWLYAYLLSPQARAMMSGSHYGQIIKHLEPSHLHALPVPAVGTDRAADLNRRARRVIELRNESHRLTIEAETQFGATLGEPPPPSADDAGFVVKVSALAGRRRRLDAANHRPVTYAIRRHLADRGAGFTTVANAGYEVWLPTRFKRIPASEGVLLWDSASLTEVNPQRGKRIADGDFGDPFNGRVEPGWLLMARSGQVYGILGTPVLASAAMGGAVISDDVMRVRPTPGATMRAGYLLTALSHPTLGRPLVKALAYGSSVPHIEVADVASFQVVRLDPDREAEIAALAEGAAAARSEADLIEQAMGRESGEFIEEFMHRPAVRLVSSGDAPAETNGDATHEFEALAERWESERPRGGNVTAMSRVPSYQAVIAMGTRALAPILKRIHREPDHWFVALHRITGENPVPPEAEGKLRAMAEAWVKWGRERGIIGELD